MSNGPDKVEIGVGIIAFLLFVLPAICGGIYAICVIAKCAVTGEKIPEQPLPGHEPREYTKEDLEYYDGKKLDHPMTSMERFLLDFNKEMEEFRFRKRGDDEEES